MIVSVDSYIQDLTCPWISTFHSSTDSQGIPGIPRIAIILKFLEQTYQIAINNIQYIIESIFIYSHL